MVSCAWHAGTLSCWNMKFLHWTSTWRQEANFEAAEHFYSTLDSTFAPGSTDAKFVLLVWQDFMQPQKPLLAKRIMNESYRTRLARTDSWIYYIYIKFCVVLSGSVKYFSLDYINGSISLVQLLMACVNFLSRHSVVWLQCVHYVVHLNNIYIIFHALTTLYAGCLLYTSPSPRD